MTDAISVWEPVKPEGLAATILIVTIFFTIICVVIVGLRIWIRVKTGLFALEDYLMCLGMALGLAHNGVVIFGCYTGIGTPDADMGIGTMMEAAKIVLIWQLLYVTSSIFIKASICATLIRISVQRIYINILWCLVALTTLANLVAFSAALARCKPIEAAWNPTSGTCLDQSVIIALTYVVSGVNIFTDWSVAILPVFILWNIQMRRRLKVLTGLILGIGVLASAATIVRMPYSSAYSATVNQLYDIGHIILWTVVECDMGIIAGSLPMLRMMVKSLIRDRSTDEDHRPYKRTDDTELVTIGKLAGGHNRNRDAFRNGVTVVADNESNEGHDSDSSRNNILVTRKIETTRADHDGKRLEDGQGRSGDYEF